MHRNRTWQIDPEELRTQRNRILPIEGGDGSTLSLDFTGGVLDPRLTFNRSSNATFINSQGYVEWAAANALSNSVLAGASGATQPTGWLVSFVGGTGSFTLNGTELTISNNGSATRSRIYQTGPTGNGLTVTVQLKVVANNTSGMSLVELLSFAINGYVSGSQQVYKVNGTTQTSGFTGWVAGDTVTLTCIPATGSAATCLFGLGVSGPVSTSASVTIKDVQIEPGSVARSYIPTTTSGAYQAPRFDYNPTTLTARGLLIEASASNLVRYSETLETTGGFWTYNAATRTIESADINPTQQNGSISFAPSSDGNGRYAGVFLTGQTTASIYTYSVWLKGKGTTQCIISIQNSTGGQNATMTILSQPSGANASIAGNGTGFPRISDLSTTGWTRVQVVLSANLGGTGTLNVLMYPKNTAGQTTSDSIFAWGAQLETGSGASSYIPTVASTGTREADFAVLSNLSAVAFNTAGGSMVMRGYQTKLSSGSYPALAAFLDSGDVDVFGFRNDVAGTVMFGRFAGTSTSAEATRTITNNAPYAIGMSADPTITTGAIIVSMNGSSTTANKSGSATAISAPAKFALTRPGYALYINCGTISSIKYWPTVKTAAELNSLTTG